MSAMVIFIVSAILSTQIALAETNVNVSNNGADSKTNVRVKSNTGENTICQNGKCTTTESGEGKSTVCVNGKCTTSEDGNINVQSENGNTTVNITNKGTTFNSTVNNTNTLNDQASKAAQRNDEIKKKIADKRNAFQKIFDDVANFFKKAALLLKRVPN